MLDEMESTQMLDAFDSSSASDGEEEKEAATFTIKRCKGVDRLYKKIKSVEFRNSLCLGRARIKKLLSKGIAFTENLKELEAYFEDLLISLGRSKQYPAEKRRLVELTKLILKEWEFIETEVGKRKNIFVSPFDMDRSDFPHAVPSAWLLESDWRDMAYKEVLSIRNKHSCLLDQAYNDSYKGYYERNEVSGAMVLSRKKWLNLVGSSREDFDLLSKQKCYDRVMSIKHFVVERERFSSPLLPYVTNPTELPYWRDVIYDEIKAIRKTFSCALDEAFRVANGVIAQTSDEDHKACQDFLWTCLHFLANSRARIALFSEDHCRQQLDGIRLFLDNSEDSVPAKQFAKLLQSAGLPPCQTWPTNSSTNWRDEAYEQLRYKMDRFAYDVHAHYAAHRLTWSKIPEFGEYFQRLEVHKKRALYFYKTSRPRMALIESKEDYFQFVDTFKSDILHCVLMVDRLRECLGETVDYWRPNVLIPKREKLSQVQ